MDDCKVIFRMMSLVSILLIRCARKYIYSHLDCAHLPVCVKIYQRNSCIIWTEKKKRKEVVYCV